MIRILDRLVGQSFFKVFVACALGAPILFILGDVTENLGDYLDRDLTGMAITKAYLFTLPQYIQWAFPVAGLVAVVFTIQTMTLHREIVAAKAGGISFHRLIRPILFVGSVLTVVALGLSEIVPRANTIAAEILQKQDRRTDYRDSFSFQGEGGRTYTVNSLNVPEGLLSEVVPGIPEIFQRGGGGPRKIGTGVIDHREFQSVGFGLPGTCNIHMHAVRLTVTIGIKFRLHPEVVADPQIGITESFHHHGLAIFEHRHGCTVGSGLCRCGGDG